MRAEIIKKFSVPVTNYRVLRDGTRVDVRRMRSGDILRAVRNAKVAREKIVVTQGLVAQRQGPGGAEYARWLQYQATPDEQLRALVPAWDAMVQQLKLVGMWEERDA